MELSIRRGRRRRPGARTMMASSANAARLPIERKSFPATFAHTVKQPVTNERLQTLLGHYAIFKLIANRQVCKQDRWAAALIS